MDSKCFPKLISCLQAHSTPFSKYMVVGDTSIVRCRVDTHLNLFDPTARLKCGIDVLEEGRPVANAAIKPAYVDEAKMVSRICPRSGDVVYLKSKVGWNE